MRRFERRGPGKLYDRRLDQWRVWHGKWIKRADCSGDKSLRQWQCLNCRRHRPLYMDMRWVRRRHSRVVFSDSTDKWSLRNGKQYRRHGCSFEPGTVCERRSLDSRRHRPIQLVMHRLGRRHIFNMFGVINFERKMRHREWCVRECGTCRLT